MTVQNSQITVAVLGGTGKEGSGLAMRWSTNGFRVIIGSRDAERAATRAAEMNAELGGDYLIGKDNASAAAEADWVVLSVPYSAHKDTISGVKDQLVGKIVIDVTVPLAPPKVRTVHVPEGKAAALECQSYLDNGARVAAAFQNISSDKLKDPDFVVDCDVLICSDDDAAKAAAMQLAEAAGMRGINAGPLANAVAVEAITPMLLYINKAYGIKGSGIRITGIE